MLHSIHGCAGYHTLWTRTQTSIMRVMLTHVAAGTFSKPFTFFHLIFPLLEFKEMQMFSNQSTNNTTRWQSENWDMKIPTILHWRQYSESFLFRWSTFGSSYSLQSSRSTLHNLWIFLTADFQKPDWMRNIKTSRERGWMGFRVISWCHDFSPGGVQSRWRNVSKIIERKKHPPRLWLIMHVDVW